jgi:hypothetical protein
MCIKYVLSHVINYKCVSTDFAIIIRVALQEYKKYTINRQIVEVSETTQQYDICLEFPVRSQSISFYEYDLIY